MEHNDVKNLRYQKPLHKTMRPHLPAGNKKRADTIMLIAIIVAALAILAMLYGLFAMSEQRVQVELENIPIVNDSAI